MPGLPSFNQLVDAMVWQVIHHTLAAIAGLPLRGEVYYVIVCLQRDTAVGILAVFAVVSGLLLASYNAFGVVENHVRWAVFVC